MPGRSRKRKDPRMIAIRCRHCDSVNLRKNGHTPSGPQQFHWKDCHASGTLATKEQERAHKQATVEKLHVERLCQPTIARTTGMSRMTVAALLRHRLGRAFTPELRAQSLHSMSCGHVSTPKASRAGFGLRWPAKRAGLLVWPVVIVPPKRVASGGKRSRLTIAKAR
jgi:hypothetical protein